jgi:hypothetical protein
MYETARIPNTTNGKNVCPFIGLNSKWCSLIWWQMKPKKYKALATMQLFWRNGKI